MLTPEQLADSSFDLVMSKSREGWIGLFSEGAQVFDPVGSSAHDPEGRGFIDKAEIGRLWDLTIATFRQIRFVVRERYVGGNDSATLYSVVLSRGGSESDLKINGIAIHTRDEQGKICRLHSYFVPAGTRFR